MMWIGGEVGWIWLIGGDVFCCTIGTGLLPGLPDVPGLPGFPGLPDVPGLLGLDELLGFQLMLGWLLFGWLPLLLGWKVGSLELDSIGRGLFSSFCRCAMWNSCFSLSYLCLSSNAICSKRAFVSGSAMAHRRLSSFAQSPTLIPGLSALTLLRSSLENHMKPGTFRFGAFGSFFALAPQTQ
jgi:hypothetical protein